MGCAGVFARAWTPPGDPELCGTTPGLGRGQDARLRGVMGEPGQAGTSKASTSNTRGDPKINCPFAACTCRGGGFGYSTSTAASTRFLDQRSEQLSTYSNNITGPPGSIFLAGDATGQVFARLCRAGGPAGRVLAQEPPRGRDERFRSRANVKTLVCFPRGDRWENNLL